MTLSAPGSASGISLPSIFLLGVSASALLFFAAALAWRKVRKGHLDKAGTRRKELLKALDLLEMSFLKRKIDQQTFEKLFREKQEELIKTEALIHASIQKQTAEEQGFLARIPARKRHVAIELLAERKKVLDEMEIAGAKYLKKQLDTKAYEQISEKLQNQLVEVQSKIYVIEKEENVKNIIVELKGKLAEIEKEQEKKKMEREREIAEEIIEQLETVHYLK